ncbi:MAG: hypothetical protein K6G38_02615 [Gammaproteobacteria bacterium]|nr:hypothetical protein [Gammaproteobacteria bacterium]
MLISKFKNILETSVKYLYPNIKISPEIEFDGRELAKLNDDGSMDVKGDQHSLNGFRISRDQPFLPSDVELMIAFIRENNNIESLPNMNYEYIDALRTTALNKAIADALSPSASPVILKVINALTRLSERTYEGNQIKYGVFINNYLKVDNRVSNISFTDFMQENYSAVLTNGTESFIEIDQDGFILRYLQLNSEKSELGLAPFNYTRILEYAGNGVISIVLSEKGEILIFHDNELKYTKRGGRWNPYNHKETIRVIHERSENDNLLFAKSVYLTALDLSFGTSGGIISFLDENEIKNALQHINIHDIVNEKYYELKKEMLKEAQDPTYEQVKDLEFDDFLRLKENGKSCVLNRVIGSRKFFQLYRKLRQELVAIDGATVIDYNGDVVAVGAIIKIEAGSKGGGRIAAARTLSNYGIAIEISSDSSIKGFALDENDEPEQIFTIADFSTIRIE